MKISYPTTPSATFPFQDPEWRRWSLGSCGSHRRQMRKTTTPMEAPVGRLDEAVVAIVLRGSSATIEGPRRTKQQWQAAKCVAWEEETGETKRQSALAEKDFWAKLWKKRYITVSNVCQLLFCSRTKINRNIKLWNALPIVETNCRKTQLLIAHSVYISYWHEKYYEQIWKCSQWSQNHTSGKHIRRKLYKFIMKYHISRTRRRSPCFIKAIAIVHKHFCAFQHACWT